MSDPKDIWGRLEDLLNEVEGYLVRSSWSASDRCLEPLVEIENRENEIVVTVDLPCVEKKEDISLEVSEDLLEIKAMLKQAMRWERWGMVQKNIEFTSFKKIVSLPEKVKPEEATAVFKRGVLKIRLPKAYRKFTLKVS
ncbi:MAG: Hsp20/alpha crystallin family protein [Nitrososphaerales archaeon]